MEGIEQFCSLLQKRKINTNIIQSNHLLTLRTQKIAPLKQVIYECKQSNLE